MRLRTMALVALFVFARPVVADTSSSAPAGPSSGSAGASEPGDTLTTEGQPLTLEAQLNAAIVWLLTNGLPEHDIGPCPNCKMARDAEARRELCAAIAESSGLLKADPWLMLAIAFREGSFTGHQVGDIGERSTFQIVADAVEWLHRKGYTACTLETLEGSAICAAALLTEHEQRCGSQRGALLYYATGRTCDADTKHLTWLAWDRTGIARKLEARFAPQG